MPSKIRFIKHKQKGFNLVEVLVTALLTSIGLIGLAGLQVSSVKTTAFATFNTRTMLAAKEMAEHIKADIGAAKTGLFNINKIASGELAGFSDLSAPVVGSPLASNMKYRWFENFNDTVPNAQAGIYCSNLGLCVIKVQFSDNDDVYTQIVSMQL